MSHITRELFAGEHFLGSQKRLIRSRLSGIEDFRCATAQGRRMHNTPALFRVQEAKMFDACEFSLEITDYRAPCV